MKVLLICSILVALASANIYDGYSVYRLHAKTTEQSDLLHRLEEDSNLDFWTDPNKVSLPVDVMVGPDVKDSFLKKINDAGIQNEMFIPDVQDLLTKEENELKNGQRVRNGIDWNSYYNLEQIYTWLRSLPGEYPGRVTLEVAGSTYENRQILGVKISKTRPGTGRRAIFVEGGIHAREWVSTATATYLINEILTGSDPEFKKISENFDWYIVPVTNPDGYQFSHTSGNRLWRKTRSVSSFLCRGTDANRNWDIYWRTAGTSTSSCSESFGGTAPFSEVETKSLSEYITTFGDQLVSYISFHSYSQLLLLPYGHVKDHLDNYDQTLRIGRKAIQALSERYGTQYVVGNIAETIYAASGGSGDWVKDKFQPPLVFTYELRDRGANGFILPPNQIIPNSLEVLDSLRTIYLEGEKEGLYTLL